MHYTWHHIHTLWQQSLVFMRSHALYSWHHLHYIWYDISTLYDITFTICVTSHNDAIYDITHSMFMTCPLYMASCTVLWQHNHCVNSQPLYLTSHPLYQCLHMQCTNFIKSSVCIISQPLYVWHHMHYIWHHMHSLWHHISLFITSSPLYLPSHPLYRWYHSHSMYDITPNIRVTSYQLYLWHHIHYV